MMQYQTKEMRPTQKESPFYLTLTYPQSRPITSPAESLEKILARLDGLDRSDVGVSVIWRDAATIRHTATFSCADDARTWVSEMATARDGEV